MGIKSDVLDNIVSTLESITVVNGYTLDIKSVRKIALPTEKLNAQDRISSCLVSFARETKIKDKTSDTVEYIETQHALI